METLEDIYDEMHYRNTPKTPEDVIINRNLRDTCYAIYSLDNWRLNNSWRRLNEWIQRTIPPETAVLYAVNPTSTQGKLHSTLLQFIGFGINSSDRELQSSVDTCNSIIKSNGFYTEITFRGLVFTKTGIAMRGFSNCYKRLLKLRETVETTLIDQEKFCSIPYNNNIIHSTILRWISPPSQEIIDKLNSSIDQWKECVFGEIRISNLIIGKATWTMLDSDRVDYYRIQVPRKILHRGLSASDYFDENSPYTLLTRYTSGLECELDLWIDNDEWFLGHDCPTYPIVGKEAYLKYTENMLIHAKDGNTFSTITRYCNERGYPNEIFYHTTEDYILTSKGNIIVFPGKEILPASICMMPENAGREYSVEEQMNMSGICSDNIVVNV